jgi:hypothetical protein
MRALIRPIEITKPVLGTAQSNVNMQQILVPKQMCFNALAKTNGRIMVD